MGPGDGENQLELFDLANQPSARMRRSSLGRFFVHLRYDQAILLGIGTLLGLTVIFACGVERGKRLVRSEQFQVARQVQPAANPPIAEASRQQPAVKLAVPRLDAAMPAKEQGAAPSPASPKAAKQKVKVADKPALSKSRYAVQVVTFARPQLAKMELDRLRTTGEPAFIVIREGRTVVYVGPFPSKEYASDKLASLKSKYQGCFIKTL